MIKGIKYLKKYEGMYSNLTFFRLFLKKNAAFPRIDNIFLQHFYTIKPQQLGSKMNRPS